MEGRPCFKRTGVNWGMLEQRGAEGAGSEKETREGGERTKKSFDC